MESKQWGKKQFWGLGSEYDPDWFLTENQRKIQQDLIELCRKTLRPNAVLYDDTYAFPKENMDALASMGLLSVIVPKELGGLGENYTCAAMAVETIARYGCPSTAMVYTMHVFSIAFLLSDYKGNEKITETLRRLDKDKLVGTLSLSDAGTGGHFWYPISSKCWKMEDGRFKTLKYVSWSTSAGFADYYVIQTTSPGFDGDYSKLNTFLMFKDEIRANTDEWQALGLHGNQSGPLVAEGLLHANRLIGPEGTGCQVNDLAIGWFMILCSSCWNGTAMGAIDIAKKHVIGKGHADSGLRVCDYPVIQDYFGEAISDTNCRRLMLFSLTSNLDRLTNNNDWSNIDITKPSPRASLNHWLWQMKFESSKNAERVTDQMLHACGGAGFKKDLVLERYLRDSKAGWLMGPTNEVLKHLVGQSALLGMASLDLWYQRVNDRALRTELKKLTKEQKAALVENLQYELSMEEHSNIEQEKLRDFDNPFNISPPMTRMNQTPPNPITATVESVEPLTTDEKVVKVTFKLALSSSRLGCFPGQYIEALIPHNGQKFGRYISPTSVLTDKGRQLEIVIRYESHGIMASFLRQLKPGSHVDVRGPCGGFEYEPGKLEHIVLVCGGIGVTPAIQIIRAIAANQQDRTKVTLFYQAKEPDQLLFKKELDTLSQKDARVNVVYSVMEGDGLWEGAEGSIVPVLENQLKGMLNGGRQKIVLCGGTPMVLGCLEVLSILRRKSEDVFVYGPFGAELVKKVYGRRVKLSAHKA